MKKLSDFFDQIYCVNYVEGNTRRNIVEQQLKDLNLLDIKDLHYSYGIPFNKVNSVKNQLWEIALQTGTGTNINSISCSFAHYMAIKAAYETGAESVLVFEDDISFNKDANMIIDYLENIPEDWDFLYFTPSFIDVSYNVNDIRTFASSTEKYIDITKFQTGSLHWNVDYNPITTWISACCYALNRKAMKLWIGVFENSRYITNADVIEYFYNNTTQSVLKIYTTNKRLFAQMGELGMLIYNKETDSYQVKHLSKKEKQNHMIIPSDPDVNKQHFIYMKDSVESIINQEYLV